MHKSGSRMAPVVQHVLDFSPNGKLFALINEQGILKVWDTETNELKQEYTPNLHLSGPCTTLKWITATSTTSTGKSHKKARKTSENALESLYLVLGTSTGHVSLYSYALGKIERNLQGDGHSGRVTAITHDNAGLMFTCGMDCQVIVWSLSEEKRIAAWSVGPEKPYSLAYLSHSHSLVIGSRQLKVYSVERKELLQTFIGHTSEVKLMSSFSTKKHLDYVLTTSQMDRIVCLWKMDKKGQNKVAACTLLMEDIAFCLSCRLEEDVDGGCNLHVASVTRSGVIHVYLLTLESIKTSKPIKPKVTIEIASDSATVIEPIPALAATLQHSSHTAQQEVLFGYGDRRYVVFERLMPTLTEKMQVLIRTPPKTMYTEKATATGKNKVAGSAVALKTITPVINTNDVEYKSSMTATKKKLKAVELPMEARLENLNLNMPTGAVPQAQSKAKLLTQALHSKDAILLRSVLSTNDIKTIQLTLQRLPVQYVGPLVNELTLLMQQKRVNVEFSINWLKILAQTHASQLMALGAEDLLNKFGPCIGIIEHRANCLKELSKLNGRLQLLVNQIKRNTEDDYLNSENLLVYEDNFDSSDSDVDENITKNSSDDEWDEEEEDIISRDEEANDEAEAASMEEADDQNRHFKSDGSDDDEEMVT